MRGYKNFDGTPHPGDLRHRVEILDEFPTKAAKETTPEVEPTVPKAES